MLIRHLTGDPPEMAARATEALAGSAELLLADLIVAECVYVLESFYEVPRERVAELMRAAIALPTIKTLDPATLLRALEVYEVDRLDFVDLSGRSGRSHRCRHDPVLRQIHRSRQHRNATRAVTYQDMLS